MSMINKHDEQAQQVYEQIVGIVGKARRCNLGMVHWGCSQSKITVAPVYNISIVNQIYTEIGLVPHKIYHYGYAGGYRRVVGSYVRAVCYV